MRVDPHYITNLTQSIDSSGALEQRLTDELSSGLRVSSVADDPVAVAGNVGLAAGIAASDAFTQSVSSVEGRLQLTDSVLGEVVAQTTAAISLAVSAGNGTLSAANLSAIGQQVGALRDSLVQLANTSYQGQYVFAGSQGNTQPFALDTSSNPAGIAYAGDDTVSHTVTPDGQSLQTSLAGSDVFTANGSSLFDTLNRLVSDLGAGNSGAIAGETAKLTAALGTVSTQRSILGSSLSRLNDATSYAASQETALKAQQGASLAADTAEVASSLSSAETQHQALLNTYAALSQTNLFSVLDR